MRLDPAKTWFTILLGIFAGLPALSIDLSAPTLTILPSALNTSAFVAGLTLSLFMVGFGIGQFFGGRLSDRNGRRLVLIIALSIYILGAFCCIFATTGEALVTSRFVQGIGAGACAVQASAMVQDLFRGEMARRKQSYVTVVITIMPMLAPAIGALMIGYLGWRSVHVVLAGCGAVLLSVVAVAVGESRTTLGRSLPGLGFSAGLQMLRESWFLRIVTTNALSYGAIFSYIAGAPIVVMGQLGYSNYTYAALFASTALSLTLGAYSNAPLGRRGIGTPNLILPALVAQAAANIVLVVASRGDGLLQVGLAVPAVMICCYSRGVVSPNLVHLGVSGHRENAGLAAAVLGLVQLMVGAGASAVVAALLPRLGFAAVAIPMAVLAAAAALCWHQTERFVTQPEPGM